MTYVTWWRMTTAGYLLQRSDVSLRAIAAGVGYTSEFAFNFNRAFRREYGMTPGNYRRQYERARSGAEARLGGLPAPLAVTCEQHEPCSTRLCPDSPSLNQAALTGT
ncbi:helix-turn-helix domain-containing protein [Streptomyces sp. NPDC026665]|uniref:helix-turn-helix domain-containing protein n=1 Tax=Streptomyces sp. NPDC026665 TaxID=3154798 RepID=UPI0033F96F16